MAETKLYDRWLIFGLLALSVHGASHVFIDAGIEGGTSLRIIPGVIGILCWLIILLRWRKLGIAWQLLATVTLVFASLGLLGFLEWLF